MIFSNREKSTVGALSRWSRAALKATTPQSLPMDKPYDLHPQLNSFSCYLTSAISTTVFLQLSTQFVHLALYLSHFYTVLDFFTFGVENALIVADYLLLTC